MIPRLLSSQVRVQLEKYPAVALLGPRQVGKTTLAKALGGMYFDLENQQDQLRINIEWDYIIQTGQLLIFDEAQCMPEIFPRLRAAIDKNRKQNGRFLLLGSISPALMANVGESLTGRLAVCELNPFISTELATDEADALWRFGGYPDGGILDRTLFPSWQNNYLQLMAQRDLPIWGLPAQPLITERLFKMLAAIHGQVWNASQIGKSLGINYHTANSYVDFLEKAYLIRRLPPYSANLKKRLIKSPKVYWRDSGLLHCLLGWTPEQDLLNNPWVGASWEGWIIEQIMNHLQTAGHAASAFHLRTNDQYEIDLLLKHQGKLWAIEIKLTSCPGPGDMEKLLKTSELVKADHSILLSRTVSPIFGKKQSSLNLTNTLEALMGKVAA